DTPRPRRRRTAPLVWAAGAVAAAVLVLGVTGTLSSWTSAILTNGSNQVGSGASVILSETGPGSTGTATTCTTAGTVDNTASCTQINKYGDAGVLDTTMSPGGSISTTVSLTNTGSGAATTFTMAPGACTSVYNTGSNSGSAPAAGDDLCSQMQVAVTCTGATLTVAATTLDAFATNSPYTLTGGLASGAAASCTFTVSLPSTTPANYSGQTVTQPIVWTLSA
ncbi:MAG: hypothetical protein J0H43_01700, partial [Actinobacteria bacterium]|nr:hypothetical protein [Actinomycetota bacterium]